MALLVKPSGTQSIQIEGSTANLSEITVLLEIGINKENTVIEVSGYPYQSLTDMTALNIPDLMHFGKFDIPAGKEGSVSVAHNLVKKELELGGYLVTII
jgi:hypothetical protein